MKVPPREVSPHIDTILTSIGFEPDNGAGYDKEKEYLKAVRDSKTRKWMNDGMRIRLLQVLSRSISKVSGYNYNLGSYRDDERIRSQTLVPLNEAYNSLTKGDET